jgi:hypothetical protein
MFLGKQKIRSIDVRKLAIREHQSKKSFNPLSSTMAWFLHAGQVSVITIVTFG